MLSPAPGANIVVRDQFDLAMVSGDAVQLQQVVMNLCTNAAQAMESERDVDEIVARSIEGGMQPTMERYRCGGSTLSCR